MSMYISGTINDFENRLHQLPETTGELASFSTESVGYSGLVGAQELDKWNKEYRLKGFQITQDQTWLDTITVLY